MGECLSVAGKSLSPDDYELTSVARACENIDRGNECHVDVDELGATCYTSCRTHYCNDRTRRPTWRDLLRRRISRPRLSQFADDSATSGNNDTEIARLPDNGKSPLANYRKI